MRREVSAQRYDMERTLGHCPFKGDIGKHVITSFVYSNC